MQARRIASSRDCRHARSINRHGVYSMAHGFIRTPVPPCSVPSWEKAPCTERKEGLEAVIARVSSYHVCKTKAMQQVARYQGAESGLTRREGCGRWDGEELEPVLAESQGAICHYWESLLLEQCFVPKADAWRNILLFRLLLLLGVQNVSSAYCVFERGAGKLPHGTRGVLAWFIR